MVREEAGLGVGGDDDVAARCEGGEHRLVAARRLGEAVAERDDGVCAMRLSRRLHQPRGEAPPGLADRDRARAHGQGGHRTGRGAAEGESDDEGHEGEEDGGAAHALSTEHASPPRPRFDACGRERFIRGLAMVTRVEGSALPAPTERRNTAVTGWLFSAVGRPEERMAEPGS